MATAAVIAAVLIGVIWPRFVRRKALLGIAAVLAVCLLAAEGADSVLWVSGESASGGVGLLSEDYSAIVVMAGIRAALTAATGVLILTAFWSSNSAAGSCSCLGDGSAGGKLRDHGTRPGHRAAAAHQQAGRKEGEEC